MDELLQTVSPVRDAALSAHAQRALLRRWLLYRQEIPAPSSDDAKAVYDWPVRTHSDRNARIASALIQLAADNEPTDILTVIDFLDRREELIGAGGRSYIINLLNPEPAQT